MKKKVLAMLLVAVMSLGLVACSGGSKEAEKPAEEASEEAAPAAEEAEEAGEEAAPAAAEEVKIGVLNSYASAVAISSSISISSVCNSFSASSKSCTSSPTFPMPSMYLFSNPTLPLSGGSAI